MKSHELNKPYTIEYYYKAKWGYAEEFIRLYKKNHRPVLREQITLGRIIRITADRPRFHATEDGRWDYRVTIVWKNIGVTNDGFDEDVIKKKLYPNQKLFRKEEQRRFEILVGHWDVPVINEEISP